MEFFSRDIREPDARAAGDDDDRRPPDRACTSSASGPTRNSTGSSRCRSTCSASPTSTATSSASTRRGSGCSASTSRRCWRQPFMDFVHPDDREATVGGARRADDRRARGRVREPVPRRDGIVPLAAVDGRAVRARRALVYAAARDVTDRKRAEAALRGTQSRWSAPSQQEQNAERLAQLVKELEVARRSADGRRGQGRVPRQHEPRDPHADERDHRHDRPGAAAPGSPRSSASYIRTAKESAEALLAILNDILDVSKIEAGRLHARPRAVRPVRDTVEDARQAAGAAGPHEKGLELACRIAARRARRASSATPDACAR